MLRQMDRDPKGKGRTRKHNYSFSTTGKEGLSMIGLKQIIIKGVEKACNKNKSQISRGHQKWDFIKFVDLMISYKILNSS